MTNRHRALVLAGLLGLLAPGVAQEKKDPSKTVLALAKQAEGGKDVLKEVKALRTTYSGARAAMNVYNSRKRGGIGFGPKGYAIEQRFIDLGEQPLDAEVLKKDAADLTTAAHVNLVMAELLSGFAPSKPVLGRGKKEWAEDLDSLKGGSRDLLDALKGGDAKAVKAAAVRINNACNRCHDGAK